MDEQIKLLQARVTLLEAALAAEIAERAHQLTVPLASVEYASDSSDDPPPGYAYGYFWPDADGVYRWRCE